MSSNNFHSDWPFYALKHKVIPSRFVDIPEEGVEVEGHCPLGLHLTGLHQQLAETPFPNTLIKGTVKSNIRNILKMTMNS